jgi:hypothetical protein
MKKFLIGFVVVCAVWGAVFAPLAVQAAPLISLELPQCDTECTFFDFVQLVQNVTTFLLLLSFPVAVILFSYAGFRLLTGGDNSSRLEEAKQIFMDVAIGLLIALTAWLVVKLITSTLLKEGSYVDFLGTNSVISDTMQS